MSIQGQIKVIFLGRASAGEIDRGRFLVGERGDLAGPDAAPEIDLPVEAQAETVVGTECIGQRTASIAHPQGVPPRHKSASGASFIMIRRREGSGHQSARASHQSHRGGSHCESGAADADAMV